MKTYALALIMMVSTSSFAEIAKNDPEKISKEVRVDKDIHRMRLYLSSDFTTIPSPVSDGVALSAIGISIYGLYAINEKWAAGLGTWQSFGLNGSSVITSFDGRLTYAVTGKLKATDFSTIIDNTRVATVKDLDLSGFRAQVLRVQYYFNASSNTVPYNGNGFSGYYEHVSNRGVSYVFGARIDMISNADNNTSPMQFFVGIGTPF